jgi:hypothetical protein
MRGLAASIVGFVFFCYIGCCNSFLVQVVLAVTFNVF